MHASFSALNTFRDCPLRYKYQEVDKIRTPQSPQQAFGSLIHQTLKYMYTPTPEGFPDEEKVIEFFSRKWDKEVFKEESDSYFKAGIRMIKDYLSKWEDPEDAKIIALEHRFIIPLGEHTLGGAIDRIDKEKEGYEIIDYKTDRKIPPQGTIDKNLQLSIYLKAFVSQWPALLKEAKGVGNIKLSLHYLRHNVRLSTTRNMEDIKGLEGEILDDMSRIEKAREENKFEPNITPLCDWCSYQKICPLWAHKFKKVPKKEKDIQKTAKKMIELKEKKKEIDGELKKLQQEIVEYFEETKLEQFFTDKGSVMKTSRKTYTWDAKEVGELLKKWKKDPYHIFKVDNTALRRIMAKLPVQKQKEIEKLKKLERESYGITVKSSS